MSVTANQNELVWMSNFLALERQLTGDELESVRNFALLWNLFEGLVCNKDANVGKFSDAVTKLQQQGNLNIDDYVAFLQYCTNRYVTNGEANDRFPKLKLQRNNNPELVEAVLKGDETAPEKVLLALLIIVYRYRNNLFHGEKAIEDLPNQIDNFKNANQLLMIFMERWR
ncbi:MAG: hypothetical protein KG029_08235 [Bacteroidetes bacterium]|nr:hypothetical protein [Bacteroidota bacterium]